MKQEGDIVGGASKRSGPERKGGPGSGGRWTVGLPMVSGRCSGSLVGIEERDAMGLAVMGELEGGKFSGGDWSEWDVVCKRDGRNWRD